MSVINILSPHLADMIAAGEVVERPASVIKELVENSFDAGAKSVTVEIRNGGAALIRVTDDGCGMSPEDAGIAFLRHATSKLSDEHGLEGIATMGFRGEALAAISAVSDIKLFTRRRGDSEGTMVHLLAGEIQDMQSAGCPDGTDIRVERLFYNTPARQKFMKSDRSEAAACLQVAIRCALSRPEVSLRFIRDGEEQLLCSSDSDSLSRIYSVLGRDTAMGMLSCQGENQGLRLSGFISSPSSCRGNRSSQYFFCNGRFIKSQLLQTALEQAYRNSLLSGRYPGCVLYLNIPFGSVDVNVHPAKTEVKFSNEKLVFDLVYYSVLAALSAEKGFGETPAPSVSKPVPAYPAPAEASAAGTSPAVAAAAPATEYSVPSASMPAANRPSPEVPSPVVSPSVSSAQGSSSGGFSRVPPLFDAIPGSSSVSPFPAPGRTPSVLPFRIPAVSPVSVSAEDWDNEGDVLPAAPPAFQTDIPEKAVEKPVENVDKLSVPQHKIVGELFKKYIIIELSDSVLLVDKHAAHERMLFDSLKARNNRSMSQSLLLPIPVRLDSADTELVIQNSALLEDFGFEIDVLEGGDFLIRSLPADISASEGAAAIEEICEKLRQGGAPDPDAARDHILHTVACKAAIKAGWDTDPLELERIAEAVLSGQVLYCPHGRPVSYKVDSKELDKRFKRIL